MPRIVQCSTLGYNGRFANQLFQFCFAKSYAEKYDAILEIPHNWVGRDIFENVNENPVISCRLPKTKLDEIPNGQMNIDLFGYFQFKEAYDFLSKSKIFEWLKFKDKWIEMLTPKNNNYIACHLRRGDYATKYSNIYCTISKSSYLEAVSHYGYNHDDIVWVSEEEPTFISNCPYDFLPDFFKLMNAEVLFRSNSTFSVWASILGRKDMITYAPIINGTVGIDKFLVFKWGNWHKVVDNYKGATPRQPSEFLFKE